MVLDIATCLVRLSFERPPSDAVASYLAGALDRFRSTGGGAGFELVVSGVDAVPPPPSLDRRKYGVRFAETASGLYFCTDRSACLIRPAERLMVAGIDGGADGPGEEAKLVVSHLRHLVSYLVVEKDGLPLHGAALEKDGRAVVFAGRSGSGKSTCAKQLAPSWTLYNDEYNVVLPDGDGAAVHATPFTRPETLRRCAPGSAPLLRLFLLHQSDRCRAEPVGTFREKCAGLLQNAHLVPSTDEFAGRLMENAGRLAAAVAVERLYFSRDRGLDRFLADHLGRE